jgi:hypothetical protein
MTADRTLPGMKRLALIAALCTAGALAPAAHAVPPPPPRCFYWTDYPTCVPQVDPSVGSLPQRCFYWTDYPLCVPFPV